jgi:copper chaperone CopZ
MSHSTLSVPEMSCGACRTTIEHALADVPGVDAVSVDLERKLVTVLHDEQRAPVARLATAVAEQGYEVTDQQGV